MSAVLQRGVCQPMRAEDLAAVLEIEQRAYEFPWTAGNFSDSLAAGYSAWCFRDGERLIGYAVMMQVLDEIHLLNLTVAPEHQRQGHGRSLMRLFLERAREHRATRMFLEVRPSNLAGLALYRQLGFTEIGRRRGYYPGHGAREDAVVMACSL